MKNLQNSNKGFSIVLAMGITIIISMIAILILEFIIPFTRNVKSVENGSAAYYFAYTGIENSLWELSQNSIGHSDNDLFTLSASTGSQFDLVSMTSVIPPAGDGNSEYDPNWNRFDQNTPIQLLLNNASVNFNNTQLRFRIPDIDRDGNYGNNGSISGNVNDPVINWIISGVSTGGVPVVLQGKDAVNNVNYIRKSQINGLGITIGGLSGITVDDITCSVEDFYKSTCPSASTGISTNHTLKLSLIDELNLVGNKQIPYLEYQIYFKDNSSADIPVPGRYSQIDTAGKSYGYKKTMDIKVPQLSTNQAFDFAVFQ